MNIIYALGGTVVGRQTTDASGVPDGAKKATEVGNTHDLNLEKLPLLVLMLLSQVQNKT